MPVLVYGCEYACVWCVCVYVCVYIFVYVPGTRRVYTYIRQTLNVPFHRGGEQTLDVSLNAIYDAIKQRHIADVIIETFSELEAH